MGCSASLHHRVASRHLPSVRVKTIAVPLSADTKNTLRESWNLVEPVKAEAGKLMFVR